MAESPLEAAYRRAAYFGESDGVLTPDRSALVRKAQACVTIDVLTEYGCTRGEIVLCSQRLHFPNADLRAKDNDAEKSVRGQTPANSRRYANRLLKWLREDDDRLRAHIDDLRARCPEIGTKSPESRTEILPDDAGASS